MRSELIGIITSTDSGTRNRSLDAFCREASADQLIKECVALEEFRHQNNNLYKKVRALFFLYAIHRFHLPYKTGIPAGGYLPFDGYQHVLNRRFEEAINIFLETQIQNGVNESISSALATAYHRLAFQTLADQVRQSVRSVRGNQWMFRTGHPADHPLKIRHEMLEREGTTGLFPILCESTPVRMDLSHSGWSDIFFLGMDFPEGARVLNVSIDLSIRDHSSLTSPKPPVEAYLRVIDRPVLRLASIDLGATAEINSLGEVFDFAKDYLGLLKAAVIASGIVPSGMEGAHQPLSEILGQIVKPGFGLELVSRVNGIPKGSRLAVSTNLLSSLIAACMRATGQIKSLTGVLQEDERRIVAARAILGEWLGGSGGGWQDSGGIWPGMKLIQGVNADKNDPEFGISRGCLLPKHDIFTEYDVSPEIRSKLQESLVLVHGGMAQDVGPILEMVTEKYLLRSTNEWQGRLEAMDILDDIINHLKRGDIRSIGEKTQQNFEGPIQTIIPWATNMFTEDLIRQVAAEFENDFYGFWMLGGMSGGGMGFIFDPARKHEAQDRLQTVMGEIKQRIDRAVPFAIEPVVYDFSINEKGTSAHMLSGEKALMPPGYYNLTVPDLIRRERHMMSPMRRAELDQFTSACRENPDLSGMVQNLFDRLLPQLQKDEGNSQSLKNLLIEFGFDQVQHNQIRADLRRGRIGLAQNRLPVNTTIEDVHENDVFNAIQGVPSDFRQKGLDALAEDSVAVVSLAGGAGSRWTHGAGVVKALNPFCKLGGRHRSFIEIHLAKSRRTARLTNTPLPHILTTSYLTHKPISDYLNSVNNYGYNGPLHLSLGKSIGLRLIPMTRDLRFAWEELQQQRLDEQAQKMVESLHTALISWAENMGEGNDYIDNIPLQCLHPVGHWFEVPNMLRNGILNKMLHEHPGLKYLLVHNIDTLGASVDPDILGYFIENGGAMLTEVITRHLDDRGGGLARINGQTRLIEGLALPNEEIEFNLSYYNSLTTWVDIEKLLKVFQLKKEDLSDSSRVAESVRKLASRMPTYITLKDVKKRWGKGQEDIYPVTQFEKLWGDMTALPELDCRFIAVSRMRGQQLKEVSQLDGWLRDGSAAYIESLCEWN